MADEPQQSNAGRINAMLSDLATQRGQPTKPPVNLPTRPTPPPATAPVPRPSAPAPAAPVRPVPPTTPSIPRPPAPPTPPASQNTPPKPQAEPYSSELRTMSADIGRISTGQPVVGTKPTPPTPVTPPATATPAVPPPSISIPETSGSSGMGRKLMYAILAIGVIAALFWVISLMVDSESTSVITPSPTPSATLSLSGKSLSSYFPAEMKGTAPDTTTFPRAISDVVVGSWVRLNFNQTEQFDAMGKLVTNASPSSRIIMIAEINDITKANQAMMAWEATIANDQKALFGISPEKTTVSSFTSGTYQQMTIRYRNFPYADQSIDYAIVLASNNKNYLVLTASRESIFYAIDQLVK